MSTGSSSRRTLAAILALSLSILLAPGSGRAQTFKLSTLRIPPDVPAGSWVSYQVDVVSKNRPPRHIAQRMAVVSREGTGREAGLWVELKTTEGGRIRTERGFFMRPEGSRDHLDTLFADETAPASGADTPTPPPQSKLRLARYQKLTPDGKLYEYPMEEGTSLPEEDISAMDMFEFSDRGTLDSLPPDTLRVGRRVVPCLVRRMRRYGSQEWEGEDSTLTYRAMSVQTYWRNPYIPVTGLARQTIEVSQARVPKAGLALADTAKAATVSAVPMPPSSPGDFFYKATLQLTDIGNDAVPEITQAPEPAPKESMPHPRILDR